MWSPYFALIAVLHSAPMRLFDSHTHLNHARFDEDRDQVWERAQEACVERAVVVAWDIESSRAAIEMAQRHEGLSATVGVSPHDAVAAPDGYLEIMRELAASKCVVAIGEIGLEYHYDAGPKEVQREIFRAQLDLAIELDLPVVIHNREADVDLLEDLSAHLPPGGVLHCFTSTPETMRAGVELGMHVSFTGIVTFKNMGGLREAVAGVPEERLLVETDCPYIAPVPYRGKRCEPSMVSKTLESLAACRETDPEQLAAVTYANACKLFRITP